MRLDWITIAVAAGLAFGADDGLERSPASRLPGSDDRTLCQPGETQFRRGNFEAAAAAFHAAAGWNPENARAWWGLGRIEEIHFRQEQARQLFAKAYQLDPRDTDILLSYLDGMRDPGARAVLLRNVIALSRASNPERAAWAAAQLRIEEHLGGRPASRLAGAYTSYRVPLSGFRPTSARQDGLLVAVRINGGKTLNLVLDTGARAILIDDRAAKGLGLEPIEASRLQGFGGSEAGESQLALARRLAVGSVQFEDCPIEVSKRKITPGADGILGAGVFERFQVRVDAPARIMELTPLDEASPPDKGGVEAIGVRKLLLVKTEVSGKKGWFLLDTGAAYTTVAREMVSPVLQKGVAELIGVRGVLSGAFRLGPLHLDVGGRSLVDLAPVSVDLEPLSRREGIEVSGVLGYSALSKAPLTVDFRRGTVAFQ